MQDVLLITSNLLCYS